jgi:serine/threonine protein kinase
VLLDLLDETLANRLDRWWKVEDGAKQNLTIIRSNENRQVRVDGMQRRLQDIGIAVARAMQYLHEKHIVLRDLKPANIGFDTSGTLKLFDFGMARPLDSCSRTEVAGTLRYMAAEVMKGNNSGLPSDVYSFGVLLWEVCTLQTPFHGCVRRGNYRKDQYMRLFTEKVGGLEGWRPSVKSIPCKHTRRLIQDCWDASPKARPAFSSILMKLISICSNKKALCWSCSSLSTFSTSSSSSSSSLADFKIDELHSPTTTIHDHSSLTPLSKRRSFLRAAPSWLIGHR